MDALRTLLDACTAAGQPVTLDHLLSLAPSQRDTLQRALKASSSPNAAAAIKRLCEPPPQSSSTSLHIYTAAFGLTIETALSAAGDPALMFEIAPRTSPRKIDWDSKKRFALSQYEVVDLVAVLLRFKAKHNFTAHGQSRDKALEACTQPSDHCLRFITRGHAPAVFPLTPAQALRLVVIATPVAFFPAPAPTFEALIAVLARLYPATPSNPL